MYSRRPRYDCASTNGDHVSLKQPRPRQDGKATESKRPWRRQRSAVRILKRTYRDLRKPVIEHGSARRRPLVGGSAAGRRRSQCARPSRRCAFLPASPLTTRSESVSRYASRQRGLGFCDAAQRITATSPRTTEDRVTVSFMCGCREPTSERGSHNPAQPCLFTGVSGSGKSSLASSLYAEGKDVIYSRFRRMPCVVRSDARADVDETTAFPPRRITAARGSPTRALRWKLTTLRTSEDLYSRPERTPESGIRTRTSRRIRRRSCPQCHAGPHYEVTDR